MQEGFVLRMFLVLQKYRWFFRIHYFCTNYQYFLDKFCMYDMLAYVYYIIRLITCFAYTLMISLNCWNKMADYIINRPFCYDDFIRSYEIVRSLKSM